MLNLGGAYRAAGKPENAITAYEDLLKLGKETLGPDDPVEIAAMNDVSVAYTAAGRLQDSVDILEKLLALHKGPHDFNSLRSMSNLAGAYRDLGQLETATQTYERTFELRKQLLGQNHVETLGTLRNLVPLYIRREQYEKAEGLLLAAYEGNKGQQPGVGPNFWGIYAGQQLVSLYEVWGKKEQAESWRGKIAPNATAAMGSGNGSN
jgi:tetratricopeptide (TPR) repeat protein